MAFLEAALADVPYDFAHYLSTYYGTNAYELKFLAQRGQLTFWVARGMGVEPSADTPWFDTLNVVERGGRHWTWGLYNDFEVGELSDSSDFWLEPLKECYRRYLAAGYHPSDRLRPMGRL